MKNNILLIPVIIICATALLIALIVHDDDRCVCMAQPMMHRMSPPPQFGNFGMKFEGRQRQRKHRPGRRMQTEQPPESKTDSKSVK